MLLNRLNGHLFPVEDTCSQGCFHIRLFKDLLEVFYYPKCILKIAGTIPTVGAQFFFGQADGSHQIV
jgi:hypothetical protein